MKSSIFIEIWKDVKDFEGLYQVSNLGRVRSLDHYVKQPNGGVRLTKGMVIKPSINYKGYFHQILHKNGKCYNKTFHRLVAEAFLPNPDNLPQVNHINECKWDNAVWNLEWCTNEYNINYGTHNTRATKHLIGHITPTETKEKISKAHTNRKDQSKPVIQYTKDGQFVAEYPSTKEAERQTGIGNSAINAVCWCKPHYNTAGGYVWKFKD